MATTFGRELKKARIDKGWKQQDVHEATGISMKYLSELENDHVDPRLSIVQRLADALEVSVDQLSKGRA
jgi:transcriptional regulator with XRE-family HTH domain